MATHKDVWDTLSKVDVSEHTEEKNGLTYLSWAWAWGTLKSLYPEAEFRFKLWEQPDGTQSDILVYGDGSASVECEVSIGDVKHSMWLPVMDFRNKAIPSPSSRDISDTKMRCLVKAIAMGFGLGFYIYAGESIPQDSNKEEKHQKASPKKSGKKAAKKTNGSASSTEDEPGTEQTEDAGVVVAYRVFAEDCKTIEQLKNFWRENKDELEKLEKTHPDIYAGVIETFSNKKKELTN